VQQPAIRQGLRPGGLPSVLRQGLPVRPGLRPPPKGGKPPPKEVR
jgi:hypothetical protein